MKGSKVKVLVGTRQSELALWQTTWVVDRLRAHNRHLEFEFIKIKTKGDKILDSPLSKIGDRGLFVKEIENALLAGEIDLAVHSMKDVPTRVQDGLAIVAMPERVDPRDVLVSTKHSALDRIPEGGRVGTSSLRRIAQLSAYRPDLRFESIRGNLDTRLRKLEALDLDAEVLAAAGLDRLGFTRYVVERISPGICLPAVGQGALGIEARADDSRIAGLVAPLRHQQTEWAVTAERAFMRELEGGCQIPIGALARVEGGCLRIDGVIASLSGDRVIRGSAEADVQDAAGAGRRLAAELRERGGDAILRELRMEENL